MQPECITLYFRNDRSDKIYQAAIESQESGFVVNFAFGRRGATLQTGTKTQAPTDYDAAKKIYDRLVAEKVSKGYSPGQDATPYLHSDKAERVSGVQCQLLNPIDESELEQFINNNDWCLQEKFDGRRMLVRRNEDGSLEAINRKGLIVAISQAIEQALAPINQPFIVDGEAIGDKFFIFDLLQDASGDLRSHSYLERYTLLEVLINPLKNRAVELIGTAFSKGDKSRLVERLRREGKEGLVLKNIHAPYAAGRPASGGHQLKYKFTESLSAIVTKLNNKRSVNLGLIDESGNIVDAGNVTIPVNFNIPDLDSIVEVRYLYAHAQSKKLYQPVYLGLRDDIDRTNCVTAQLKLKAVIDEEE